MERDLPAGVPVVARRRRRLGKRLAPYLLTAPGGLWLLVFFLIPVFAMLSLSLQEGSFVEGYQLTWNFAQFPESISRYDTQLVRSIQYGGIATVLALVVAYPLAYWIAFHGGRRKSTFLLLLLLPFFVTFVIRTLSWQFILSDRGFVIGTLSDWGVLPGGFHVLATSGAVVAGIFYNFLPFMALPLYVSLEKIDRGVVEAARDLYASKVQVFLRVILPLSAPGVFAGVLLTFVPAVGDYINSELLGGVGTTMIGNIIQEQYLENLDYPRAAALSSVLMGAMLIGIFLYARLLGTRQIEEYV